MTREEIETMEPGRGLDALIAEIVMGYEMVGGCLPAYPKYYVPEYDRTFFRDVPFYSTDIGAAFMVVEMMRMTHKQYITIIDNPHLNFDVRFSGDKNREYVRLSSLPYAIGRAALLAVLEG